MNSEKFRIFDDMIEGIQIIDHNFRYHYVNKTVSQHGKSTVGELTGFTMMEKYPGIENTEIYKLIEKCMSDGQRYQMTNEFDFADGSKGYFELRVQPIEEGVLVLSFDVTDQKRAEKIVKDSNALLEEEVAIRLKEINEQKIIIEKQLKDLEQLNVVKDKFFGIVAHDLRTPLNSLKSFSDIVMTDIHRCDKDEVAALGKELSKSVDNVIALTENLIIWAGAQMKEFSTRSEKIALADILLNIMEVYKKVAAQKEIDIEVDIEKDITVLGDKNQVEFIIRNLVNNAIKYTPRGGLVKIKAKETSDNEIKIVIIDNGVGIPEELKASIFTVGQKQGTQGTEGERGTGLGLALCYEFAKLNGGTIEFSSELNKGTTFQMCLRKQV